MESTLEQLEQQMRILKARLAAAEARIRALEARNRPIGPDPLWPAMPQPPFKPRFLRKDGQG